MDSSNNTPKEIRTDRVVVVNGTSFGTAMKFIALGAAIGAGAAFYWTSHQKSGTPEDAVTAGVTGGYGKPGSKADLLARITKIASRLKSLAGKAGASAHTAGQVLGPVIADALHEARNAAVEAQEEIREELDRAQEADSDIAHEQA